MELIRLSKILSERKICSRREAEHFIACGLIEVDGKIINTQGTKVSKNAKIVLLEKAKKIQKEKVTILLNKPLGYVSNLPERGYPPAIDLLRAENHFSNKNEKLFHPSTMKKLAVAGRLDIDSKGLLVFTQDGVLAKRLIGENSTIEKEYLVRVDREVQKEMISKLSYGLSLDGCKLKKAEVLLLEPMFLKIILKEGKKRQIRRMCELVGLKVLSLKRVRIGKICLGNLPVGKWRYLRPSEQF